MGDLNNSLNAITHSVAGAFQTVESSQLKSPTKTEGDNYLSHEITSNPQATPTQNKTDSEGKTILVNKEKYEALKDLKQAILTKGAPPMPPGVTKPLFHKGESSEGKVSSPQQKISDSESDFTPIKNGEMRKPTLQRSEAQFFEKIPSSHPSETKEVSNKAEIKPEGKKNTPPDIKELSKSEKKIFESITKNLKFDSSTNTFAVKGHENVKIPLSVIKTAAKTGVTAEKGIFKEVGEEKNITIKKEDKDVNIAHHDAYVTKNEKGKVEIRFHVNFLGAGASGNAFKLYNATSKTFEAMKLGQTRDLATAKDTIKTLEVELNTGMKLNPGGKKVGIQKSPNSCIPLSSGSGAALIMPLYNKGSAERCLNSDSGISLKQRIEYAKQGFEGLKNLQEGEFFHSDIKPENLFVSDTRMDICDWGEAQTAQDLIADLSENNPSLLALGQGTEAYTPPGVGMIAAKLLTTIRSPDPSISNETKQLAFSTLTEMRRRHEQYAMGLSLYFVATGKRLLADKSYNLFETSGDTKQQVGGFKDTGKLEENLKAAGLNKNQAKAIVGLIKNGLIQESDYESDPDKLKPVKTAFGYGSAAMKHIYFNDSANIEKLNTLEKPMSAKDSMALFNKK